MPEKMPYGKRYWYPHMEQSHATIWERFMTQFPDMYDECAYDVPVGHAPAFVLEADDPAIRAQAKNYQYKIDVVGYKGDQVDIIEIRPNADMGVFGKVNSYNTLFVRDWKPSVRPKSVVVTDRLRPEMGELAHDAGVQLVVV